MKPGINRRMALAGAGLALVAGGGGAYAATKGSSPDPQQERQAVLDGVAKRLGVTPAALSDAFKASLADRVDAAVAAGRLTKAQGDKLKAAIQAGQVPFFGGPGLEHRHGFGHVGVELSSVATYVGVTEAQLRTELESGKSLAQIATDHGKDVSGLVDVLVKAETAELDQAVKDGRLTQAQESQILGGLKERITAMVQNAPRAFHGKTWGAPPQPAA